MVIAVERDDDFILNPPASIIFQKDDTVWFVSTENNAKELVQFAHKPNEN